MNRPDFKEKNGTALPGRGLLIMVVIFFSSISFALGYFVGKSLADRDGKVLAHVTLPPPAPGSAETGQASPEKAAPTVEPDAAAAPEKEQHSAQAETQTSAPPAKESPAAPAASAKDTSGGIAKETAGGARRTNAAPEIPATAKQEPGVTYTVQLGALKSASEAKKIRAKLLKKGYKTYIIISTNGKKHEKIYKIRTGEFQDKKEAEMLAVKLKNTEGLKTFVTPRN
jgi:cell division septation protein DedD